MAEQNPLLAQYAGARQVAQGTPMRVSAGQGMAPGQVAQYLQGNALNVAQRLDGRANNMVESDPAVDIRARERFQEQMDQQVYADNNAMDRQKIDLEGRMAMADAQNALTKELGYARINSAEDMQDRGIEGQKEILNIQLTDKEKDRVEDARKFDTRQAWMEKAKQLDLDDNEADRVWRSLESDKQIESVESEGDKNREVQEKKIESSERVSLEQIQAQLKIAGDENDTRRYLGDMQNDIDKARTFIMQDEVNIKGKQVDNQREISLLEIGENRRQFNENLDLGFAKIDADMAKADASNARLLKIARLQLEGTKYNVDKSFEIKELEMADINDKAQAIAPMIKDMFDTANQWKTTGRNEFLDDFEESFIASKAFKYNISITDSRGNINPQAYEKAKQLFYADEKAVGEMRSLRDTMYAQQERMYAERIQDAYKAANKFGVDTGSFGPVSTPVPPPSGGNPNALAPSPTLVPFNP